MNMHQGDLFRHEVAGGGGWGDPLERDPALVLQDVRNDFVSEVDHAAEAEIIKLVRKNYPNHAFLAEESGRTGDSDTLWIIDPLDGTTNFLHGFPTFAVSIACQIKAFSTSRSGSPPLRSIPTFFASAIAPG